MIVDYTYREKVKNECTKGNDWLLSLDGDPDVFFSYLKLLKDGKFTTPKIRSLLRYTVNLDSGIRHAIASIRDLSGLTTLARPKMNSGTKEIKDAGDPQQEQLKEVKLPESDERRCNPRFKISVPHDHRPRSWSYQLHDA